VARGGRGGRSYVRDSRGRFASTPGGGKKAPSGMPKRAPRKVGTPPPKRRGLVTQRAAVKRASTKLKGLDISGSYSGALRQRGQKAAVTRAGNRLKAAEATGRRRIAGGKVQGVVRVGAKRMAGKAPKLQFDAAANARRLARATANIDKAFDRRDAAAIAWIAGIRKTYMNVASWTKGDAIKARDLYRSQPKYSTIRNPKPKPESVKPTDAGSRPAAKSAPSNANQQQTSRKSKSRNGASSAPRTAGKPRSTPATRDKPKTDGAGPVVRKVLDGDRGRTDLRIRANMLRQAYEERRRGEKRRSNFYVGRAAQGAEYANFSMSRTGGSTQLERAAVRAGRRYAALIQQLNNTTNPKEKKAIKRRADLAWTAFASYPKTRFSWNM
jgi:hypothetical protein